MEDEKNIESNDNTTSHTPNANSVLVNEYQLVLFETPSNEEMFKFLTKEEVEIVKERQLPAFDAITSQFATWIGSEITQKYKKEEENKFNPKHLVYGEISFEAFAAIFSLIKNKYSGLANGGKFYDLGSGFGKAVLSAAMLHEFDECIGIEILPDLIAKAQDMAKIASEKYPNELKCAAMTNRLGNILEQPDWMDGSVIFCNSTCFERTFIAKLAELGYQCKIGTYFISTTKSLADPYWKLLETVDLKMSWGRVTVHIHQRIDPTAEETVSQPNTWLSSFLQLSLHRREKEKDNIDAVL